MDDHPNLFAATIGHCAQDILQSGSDATIWGQTSKGVFAVTKSKKVLFLSQKKYRGPLTINLSNGTFPVGTFSTGTRLNLSPDQIRFIPSDLKIEIHLYTSIWNPKVNKFTGFELDAFIFRSKEFFLELNQKFSNQKFDPPSTHHGIDNLSDIVEMKEALFTAFSTQENPVVIDLLTNLLGYGEGLTPSGDDFICGFLLAAHAWKDILAPNYELKEIINQIVISAPKKTTAISANLIACASNGSADERIINCLNWLTIGGLSSSKIIEELLSYGSSSGMDTMAGMLAFIQSSPLVNKKL